MGPTAYRLRGYCLECGHATWRHRIGERWRLRRRWFFARPPLPVVPLKQCYGDVRFTQGTYGMDGLVSPMLADISKVTVYENPPFSPNPRGIWVKETDTPR